jgi:hypothetical protein
LKEGKQQRWLLIYKSKKTAMRVLFVLYLITFSWVVTAQKNLIPASKSALVGIGLPQGSKLDNRLLYRAAAKTTMDLEAADSNWILTENYEVFLMPVNNENDISDSIITALESIGWTLQVNERNNKWGVASKGSRRLMIYFQAAKKESWLYMAEISTSNAAKPATTSGTNNAPVVQPKPAPSPLPQPTSPAATVHAGGYQFHTTNFDDGWTANEKKEWIEVTKDQTTVLLHFANTAIDMSSGDSKTITSNAWNVLVAPRYKGMSNFYLFGGNMSYNRTTAISANMTDHDGRNLYVVLFRKGGSGWMEFITPDKTTFTKQFGMDISQANNENLIYSEEAQWEPMLAMQNRNKFAVAPSDLSGNWNESSGSYAQMYNVYTGNYAGMNAVSNSAEFWIEADGSYRSQHSGANGMVGSQTFFTLKYNGRYTMNGNWEVSFSNRHNGKTDTYWCQFEIVRGGRVLHLQDKQASSMQYHLTRK